MGDRADFIPSNNLLSAPLWHVIGLEKLRVSVCNVDGFVNISPRGTKRQRECELQKKFKMPCQFAAFNMSSKAHFAQLIR